jgi:acyl-coenzyme A synthetase/AMP-(fatty) acid ligase
MASSESMLSPMEGSILYGRRLLNVVIDQRAAAGHDRPYASIPKSSTISEGFRDISYGLLANAVNRCTRFLTDTLGHGDGSDTIAYIGPADLRYQILSLAAVKSGHVVSRAAVCVWQ